MRQERKVLQLRGSTATSIVRMNRQPRTSWEHSKAAGG